MRIMVGVFVLLASIVAIGGDTWRKEPGSWYQRVTHRGWIAIFALLMVFLFGVIHEILDHKNALQSARIASVRHDKLKEQLVEVSRVLANLTDDPSHATAEFARGVERSGFPELARSLFQPLPRWSGKTVVVLRSGPSTKYPKVGRIALGEPVRRLDSSGEWYKVETVEGIIGYVYSDLVKSVVPVEPSSYR